MTELISSQRLAELGVHGYEPGDVVELMLPTDQSGEAQSLAAGLAAIYLASTFTAAGPSLSRLLETTGIQAELGAARPSLVRLTTSDPTDTPRVLPNDGGAIPSEALLFPPDEPGVVVIDLARCGQATVVFQRGGLSVRLSGERLTAQEIRFRIEPLAAVTAPLNEWLRHVTDEWVLAEAARLIARQSSWSTAATAGLLARYGEPTPASSTRAAVERFLRGDVDSVTAAPRLWARRLDDPEKRTISDLTLAATDVLHHDIEDVGNAVNEGELSWPARWRGLCERRDHVENVRVILFEAHADLAVSSALLDVDRRGEALRLSIPWSDALLDERARRVGLLNPFAWWGSYAAGDVT